MEHASRKGQEPLEFLDALKRDQETGIWRGPRGNAYIARSLYSVQLEKLYNLFPRKQVLVLKYEELRRNPFGAIDRVFDFIWGKKIAQSPEPTAKCRFLFPKIDFGRARIRIGHFRGRHHERGKSSRLGLQRLARQSRRFSGSLVFVKARV